MDIYDSLNEEQYQAVTHKSGPLLVLAGAGSGKTRVITHRIAHLIRECGVSPYRILAITFTNKAANEMKERVARLLDDTYNDVWVSTFHSACVRMLRRFCTGLGYDTNFAIYDTDDQKRAMKDVLRHLNIDVKQFPPKQVLAVISKAKNELIGPAEFRSSDIGRTCDRNIARAYTEYQEFLQKNNAFDFDDLLMKTVEMLRTNLEALAYYQDRFEHILVDEYQDTNTAQVELVRLRATHINRDGKPEHNLCVVGDDDQSIYSFRGANIRNILDFEKTYPDATVIKLEQNYRSTRRILEAANAVIKNNVGRKEKSLRTDNEEGELIRVTEFPSDLDEAKEIVREIGKQVRDGHSTYSDYAILYRTNAQSRAFEEQFVYSGIPYRLVGGTNFYERMEIRDMLAYLRVIENGNDAVSLKRIINVPKRGIGDTTVDRVDDYAYVKDISLYDALCNASDIPSLGSRAVSGVRKFTELIDSLREKLSGEGYHLPQIIDDVVAATGYEDELKAQEPEKADDRMNNIAELKNKLVQYEQQADQPSLSGFLAEVALVADIDSIDSGSDYVVLMTLHSAKGLEFNHVFISGLEDGLFPSSRSIEQEEPGLSEDEGIEEERRLFYVGITRAMQSLMISYAVQRMTRGEMQFNRPSRFLSELPREITKKTVVNGSGWSDRNSMRNSSGRYGGSFGSGSYSNSSSGRRSGSFGSGSYGDSSSGQRRGSFGSGSYDDSSSGRSDYYSSSGYGNRSSGRSGSSGYDTESGSYRKHNDSSNSAKSGYGNLYSKPATPAPVAASASALGYGVGDRVRHIKFGIGTVKSITAGSHDYEVTVEFAAGVKQMLASFAKLVKVD